MFILYKARNSVRVFEYQFKVALRKIRNRSNHPEVFLGKGVQKYAANLQENTHAKV